MNLPSESMEAMLLHGERDLRPTRVPIPFLGDSDVRIRVTRAGICGSDLHYYRHGRCGSFVPSTSFILGHEFTGEVVKTGFQVIHLPVGARVAVDPSQPCRACEHCHSGRYNLCADMKYLGTASVVPPRDGAFAEFIVVPAINCHLLPDDFSDGAATMLEPLSVAAHALKRAGSVAGRSLLVTGGGPIGQMVVVLARAFGARFICLSDPRSFSRKTALLSGADVVIDPGASVPENLIRSGFDIAFEASGAPRALQFAIEQSQRGGTIVQVGTLPDNVTIPANQIMAKELQLLGAFRFANVFNQVIDLLSSGRLKVEHLVTKVVSFEDLPEAFAALDRGEDLIKVQVEGVAK